MNSVVLTVNGKDYAGWKSIRITRGIESIAGSFELSVSDRWNGQDAPWPIGEEDQCSLSVNGVTLITGYVDTRDPSFDSKSHTLTVGGRDKTGALVDNSANLKVWEFAQLPLKSLLTKLCAPFGIPVTFDPGIGFIPTPPDKFSIDPGESSFAVIDRACRLCGVLPVSDGLGGLLITRAGTNRTEVGLVQGQNLLSGSAHYDATGKFSTYIVTGQKRGTDESFGLDAAAIRATASDLSVIRTNRVLLVRAESSVTPVLAKQRAQWEAAVRSGRSAAITGIAQDWTQTPGGALWPLNTLVPVKSSWMGVDGDLLITQLRLTLSEAGTFTEFTLKDPDSFLPQPVIPREAAWKELANGV